MRLKLKYHTSLYLGRSIPKKKLDRIKKRLSVHPLRAGVYLITIAPGSGSLLEIYGSPMLVQGFPASDPPFVVGIAGDYQEAVELVTKIAEDCLKARGDCALKEYLLC